MTTLLWLMLFVAAAIVAGWLWLGRSRSAGPTQHRGQAAAIGQSPAVDLVRIVPVPGDCCEQAFKLRTHRFEKARAPALPLANCSMPRSCACRLEPVAERRSHKDRRTGGDRREDIRFEPEDGPRRKSRGRRMEDGDWDDHR